MVRVPQQGHAPRHRVVELRAPCLVQRLAGVFDLSYAEFDILATLRRAGAPYQRRAGELADHTMVTSGGLTKRVDRLIARGLVERRPEASDALT